MLVVGGPSVRTRDKAGTGIARGTCGELMQAFLSDGTPFHITCPIDKTATVSVTLRAAEETTVVTPSAGFDKMKLALAAGCEYLDLGPHEIRVAHWTDLDVSKGMGASTADIVAGLKALATATGKHLSPADLATISTSVESSDGSMYDGIVAMNHKTGELLRRYTWWPQYIIVMVVPRKRFNTESANFEGKEELGPEFDRLLEGVDHAMAERDAAAVARAATRSAALNQRFVPNPYFALLEGHITQLGAVGLNVGHTGTVAGLLFDADDRGAPKAAAAAVVELQNMFPESQVETTLTPPRPSGAHGG